MHVIILPTRMPFGDYVRLVVRRVAAIKCRRLTVCCAPSRQFMFPTATDFVDCPERMHPQDVQRITQACKTRHPSAAAFEIVHSHPEVDVEIDIEPRHQADILVAPRWKPAEKFAHRNWPHWRRLTELLQTDGADVAAVGAADMSADCGVPLIADTREIAQAMLGARMVIATDAGIAHLAVLMRVPLAIIWGEPVGVIPGQDYRTGCHAVYERQKRAPVYHLAGAWESAETAFEKLSPILCSAPSLS